MATTLEANRYLYLTTPLGDDQLLLLGFSGHESLSQLFSFQLDLMAEIKTTVDFDKLIGQKISFGVLGEKTQEPRHFSGIVTELAQGGRDRHYTLYRMTIAPDIWKMTRNFRSRIFQHISVPDILKKLFTGFDVAYELQGTFEQREYCTQYQESDFAFASRLMEEEGIYYFFKFTQGNHKLVIANTPQSHSDLPNNAKLIYEEDVTGGHREEERVTSWEKAQSWGSGKYTLWDHHFELAHKNLEAKETIRDTVAVGKVQHKLKVGGNDQLEIYEYPGRYAQRFDGIDKSGGEKSADLQKIFQDNKRTAGIRMQQTETPTLLIEAGSNYWQVVSGHKFTLQRHFNADGQYVVVAVSHHATEGGFRSGDEEASLHYGNTFTCIPFALPYRPQRVTPRPLIPGPVTAVVTGPSGEEIFTDKYGRVKVKFHWDRENDYNADSSCWLRVASMWAGKQWGSIFIPRVGHEVVVLFLEGDPDRPIVTGSVYNSDTMPPWGLPAEKTRSGIKSNSTIGSGGFNEFCMDDTKGKEQIRIHGQYDMDARIEHDDRYWVGRDRHEIVGRDQVTEVARDTHLKVSRNIVQEIGQDLNIKVGGKAAAEISGSCSLKVGGAMAEQIGGSLSTSVSAACYIKAGSTVVIEAGAGLTLKGPGGFITIGPAGIQIVGTLVTINSGGAALPGIPGMLVSPLSPIAAMLADHIVPGSEVTYKAQLAAMTPAQQAAANAPTHDSKSEENKQKKHWIEIELVDEEGKPAAGVRYRVTVPDGGVEEGTLDEKGFARVDGIDPGTCKVTFPELDKEAWEPK